MQQTFGYYNPVLHHYQLEPASRKKRVSSPTHGKPKEESDCVGGAGRARVAPPSTQGVYDPVKNSWLVPPRDSRVLQGLSFAPVQTFRRQVFR